MRGPPFDLHRRKGVGVEALREDEEEAGGGAFWRIVRKEVGGLKEGGEPRSVLDDRRSPSSPTSTSTLSSSLGGGGSTDIAGVAAVYVNPASGDDAAKRDDWAAELHSFPVGMDTDYRSGAGAGADEFPAMFPAEPSPANNDQTILGWIMGEIEDPSSSSVFKNQLLQELSPELVGGGFGGLVDATGSGFGFEHSFFSVDTPATGFVGPTSFSSGSSSGSGFPCLTLETFSGAGAGGKNAAFHLPEPDGVPFPVALPSGFPSLQESDDPHLLQTQNPAFMFCSPSFDDHPPQLVLPPQPKRHHFPDLLIRRNHPPATLSFPPAATGSNDASMRRTSRHRSPAVAAGDDVVDQLVKASEMLEAGNSTGARGILARLNHQLPSPIGKPLIRSAFYFKEALQLLSSSPSSTSPAERRSAAAPATPLYVILKLSAYKAFSDVSPVPQFTNFTSVQALLEELGAAGRIHIIDFDIGIGGQWSSFMQELAQRRSAAATAAAPVLKITAFVDPSAHHPLELHLTRENLSHFAAGLGIPFQFDAVGVKNAAAFLTAASASQGGDAIAVNISVNSPAFNPSTLRLVKLLSPKIVISVDHGGGGPSGLPFSHHFMRAFQSSVVLLDSIDAGGAAMEVSNKIERFLLQPRIENCVLGHHHRLRCAEKQQQLPWPELFASSGFVPLQFSNFTEIQAECLLKRLQVRGFHIEKRQASLFLLWQRGELVSVSAWRCC